MLKLITTILILLPVAFYGQTQIQPSESFSVTGEVKQEQTFTLSDFQNRKTKRIKDVAIINPAGVKKGTAKKLKGILLKELLSTVEFKTDKPSTLNEFYLALVASDGYKVVYSWNEIFNSPTGDNLYLVTEKQGKNIRDLPERILLVTTTDFITGRRYIKGLKQIIVARVK